MEKRARQDADKKRRFHGRIPSDLLRPHFTCYRSREQGDVGVTDGSRKAGLAGLAPISMPERYSRFPGNPS